MICDVKDIPIFYEEYGEGVAMLCIHGYGVDRRLMTGCLEPLFARKTGYRRIYPDLPGMGKTPARDWLKNADQMLEIVIEFIEKTIGDEDFIIAGESYGGYLTLGLLHKMPAKIRGALFIAPSSRRITVSALCRKMWRPPCHPKPMMRINATSIRALKRPMRTL